MAELLMEVCQAILQNPGQLLLQTLQQQPCELSHGANV